MTPDRRRLITGAAALGLAGAGPRAIPLDLSGVPIQGGALIGRTLPRADLRVDGQPVGQASANGLFIVGFDRDAQASCIVQASHAQGVAERVFPVARGDFDVQRINGLPQDTVTPSDPDLLARIRREAAAKAQGFASVDDADGFRQGFTFPVEGYRISGRFGNQRVLNGVEGRPHYGIDLACDQGTPIRAPAPGLVVLAEPALHFEGGLTLIDHGQGLVAAYLHQSRLNVRAGQRVVRGQVIGAVGRTGRATGPHLCWRLKWRGRNLDPSRLVGMRESNGSA